MTDTATKSSRKKQGSTVPSVAVLDVVLIGRGNADGEPLTFDQAKGMAGALSTVGQVFHQPTGAAVYQHEGETLGMVAHRLRIHVPKRDVFKALDMVQAYHETVLPHSFVLAEIANVMVVAL